MSDKEIELRDFKTRTALPQSIRDFLFTECGHRCSVTGCQFGPRALWIHHMDSNPSNNETDNLIVLCASHAQEADKGDISKQQCRIYKQKLNKRDRQPPLEKNGHSLTLKAGNGGDAYGDRARGGDGGNITLNLNEINKPDNSQDNVMKLRERALKTIHGIRDIIERYRKNADRLAYGTIKANTEEDRKRLWNEMTIAYSENITTIMLDYSRYFKTEAIIIKDELIRKLPKLMREHNVDSIYEHPTNPLGIEQIVDDLEKLVKMIDE
jgi:hypothetical protein